MRRKTTPARFRLPYGQKQTEAILRAACMAEVVSRGRKWAQSECFGRHIADVSGWLASDSPKFGLFLCGRQGNGKTTLAKALRTVYQFVHSDETTRLDRMEKFIPGFDFVSARELVRLAKAYNNPTRDNSEMAAGYRRMRDVEILCIDDLGTEPVESMSYGNFVNAAMDMIGYRYDEQLCTIATSNLAPGEISKHYDERFADRFREMMHVINFGNEQSFRNSEN